MKMKAKKKAGQRFCSLSHRGDQDHYPENSGEGVLSAVLMGADCIEIDIRLTKDCVPVLMHDATLKRTTNVVEMMGKNGLPNSLNVADWTYDQLMELVLTKDGVKTDYKVLTLYEAAVLAAGRCFLHLDDKTGTLDLHTDVYDLGADVDSKITFLYYYGYQQLSRWVYFDKSDKEFIEKMDMAKTYHMTPGYSPAKRNFSLVSEKGDNEKGWLYSVSQGYNMVFTNHIFPMCEYINKFFVSTIG